MKKVLQEDIILGSGSPRRLELLQLVAASFEVDKSTGEEIISSTVPSEVVLELAQQKALEVAMRHEGKLVIGADTVVALDTEILGKPKNAEDACRMLSMLQGKVHQVYTGVCLLKKDGEQIRTDCFYECTNVHVAAMTEEEIAGYVATGEPMDKAGAYGIQGLFAPFISGIEGDYYNVVGLPVHALYQHLQRWGE